MIVLSPEGVLNYNESSGTYASSVIRATGMTIDGGENFWNGGSGYEQANLLIGGSGSGNTSDSFGPLNLSSGAFFGKFAPNVSSNELVTFASLTRNPGTQFNFGHASSFGLGVGVDSIASATADSVNVVFTTLPTSLMVGGNGAVGTDTVNILPFVFINDNLATYDSTSGLRALTAAETTATLTSGSSTATNVKVASAHTISAATTVNSLYMYTSGSIGGTGTLTVTSGAIVFWATSSINVATLNFGAAEGCINVDNNLVVTVNSVITGSNGLTICLEDYNNANANLILGGANTYTGVTTIEGNNTSLKVSLTNGLALQDSTLDYSNYGASLQFGSGTTNVTAATFGGLNGTQNLALTNSGSGGGAVTLTVGVDGDSTAYSGVLSGTGGLTFSGTGTLTLAGLNTYTGATTVSNGTLLINGSSASGSAVSVNSGATLGGLGTIAGITTVASGGILAPGEGEVLTFSGGLTLNGGSVININLDTSTTSESLSLTGGSYTPPASGTVTINLNDLSEFGPGTYNLITGATGISASSFTLDLVPAGYSYVLSASGGTLSVTVTANGE